jgi:hypothetical protein
MDLERELRDVLTSEQRTLPTSLVPLERVHARAARRRTRRRVAVGASALVVAAGLAVPVGIGFGTGPDRAPVADSSPTPTTSESAAPTPSDSPSPAPSGLAWDDAQVTSVTATSTRTLVVLGATATGPCRPTCLRLAESHDGGASFTPLPVPGSAQGVDRYEGPAARSAASVRFGSGADGWLFGGGLWSTHDGGHHWSAVDVPGDVYRLEAAAGTAWALVTTGTKGREQLWRSPVGVDGWEPVPDVRVDGPADLAVQGGRVVVLGVQQSPAWSNANGAFVQTENPCAGSLQTRLTGSGDLWATCVTGMAAYLARSTDDGATWTRLNVDNGHGALPNSVVVGARSNGAAVLAVADPDQPLSLLSGDGSLTAVRRPPLDSATVGYLGFTSRDVGYAVVADGVWRTEDGGDTWRKLTLG